MLHAAIIRKRIRSDEIELELAKLDQQLWLGRDVLETARQDCIDEADEHNSELQHKLQASNLELGNVIIQEEERLSSMELKHSGLKDLGTEYRTILRDQETEMQAKRKSIKQLQRHVEIIAEGGGEQVSPAHGTMDGYDEYGLPLDAIAEDEQAAELETAMFVQETIRLGGGSVPTSPQVSAPASSGPAAPASPAPPGSPTSPSSLSVPGSQPGSPPSMNSRAAAVRMSVALHHEARSNRTDQDKKRYMQQFQELPGLDLQKMLFHKEKGRQSRSQSKASSVNSSPYASRPVSPNPAD